MNFTQEAKCYLRLAEGQSKILINLYVKIVGNLGIIPYATVQIWVIPFFFNKNLF
jgi:hypothetical protein